MSVLACLDNTYIFINPSKKPDLHKNHLRTQMATLEMAKIKIFLVNSQARFKYSIKIIMTEQYQQAIPTI